MSANAFERWRHDIAGLDRLCFDTETLIYGLESREPWFGYAKQALGLVQAGQAVGIISTVVEMEMLVKPMQDMDDASIDRIEIFLRGTPNLFIRGVDREIARMAARIRARVPHRCGPIDSIIAATAALEHCDALITNDDGLARCMREAGIPYLYLNDYLA